jgi:HK97 family phage prohead protease
MDGDQGKTIIGYASVFYNGDPNTEFDIYGDGFLFERMMPGAFDRAIIEDDVRGLENHDINRVLGRTKAGTLRLSTDAIGLRYEIDVPATTVGRDLTENLRLGNIDGSSFSFVVTDSQVRVQDGKRILEIAGVRLFDVGPVTFPAYGAASSSVRSVGGGDQEMRQRIEAEDGKNAKRLRDLRLREMDLHRGRIS